MRYLKKNSMNDIFTKNSVANILTRIALGLSIFFLGFAISRAYSIVSVPDEVTAQQEDLELFWRVWNTLEGKYPFEEPTTQEKFYAAIEGLTRSYGDSYTSFLPPQEATFFNETVTGEFGGIGAEVNLVSGLMVIVSPLENSPAQEAGLMPGDIVTKINGEEIIGKTLTQATSLIRGEVGTDVTLTIVREGVDDTKDTTITRDIVTVPVIETKNIENVFVIALFNFNETSQDEFEKALKEFKKTDSERLLIDLRNNPGGYLEAATGISSYFLPQGKVIVKEDFGNSGREDYIYRSSGNSLLKDKEYDVAVLVNRGSASASEILAAALADHDVATIIGEQTFGKGSVQELIQLPNDTALKVTIARWLTPNGTVIQDEGIIPGLPVRDDATTIEDEQLLRAVDYLKTK